MEFVKADKFNLERQVKKLYKTAFPIYERKPFGMIKKTRKNGTGEIYAIMDENRFVGLAIFILTEEFALLDYFAMAESVRGKGLGSKALQKMFELYDKKTLILEIESTKIKSANDKERTKRKAFYLKNGMKTEDFVVEWFGTQMEILIHGKTVSYEEYHDIFVRNFSEKFASNIKKIS